LRLLVLGNAAVDRSFSVPRLPMPGETVLAAGRRPETGGKGLNQAVTAARAGAATRLVAAIGADAGGELIRMHLVAEGIAADGLHVAEAATDESIVLVTPEGENVIVSTAAAAARLSVERALAEIDTLTAGDLLLLQGNLGQPLTAAALRRAKGRGLRAMINPAPVAFDYAGLLQLADVVVLNAVEAASLGSVAAGVLILTEGARGARLVTAGREIQVQAPAVQVVDTTGAGDVVCGVVAAGLVLHVPIEAALRWAVAAAALKVSRAGASAGLPTADELRRLRP
jgi:ribokinase